MNERMTICNMSIEAGAKAGMIAPDDTTYEFLANRAFAPKGRAPGTTRCNSGARCLPTRRQASARRLRSMPRASFRW